MQRRSVVLFSLLALLLSPVLSWAGGQGEAKSESGKVPVIEAMIKGDQNSQEMFKRIVDAFNINSTDVQAEYFPLPEDSWTKIRAMMASNTAPDVIRVDDDDIHDYAISGKLTHLDPYIDKYMNRKDYYDATWTIINVNGKTYAGAVAFATNVIHYNTDMVAQAGVSFPSNWKNAQTWNEFVTTISKLTKDANADGRPEQWGIGFPNNVLTAVIYANGANPLPPGDNVFDFKDPRIEEILQDFCDLDYKYHYLAPIEEVQEYAGRIMLMVNNKLAAAWQGEHQGSELEEAGMNWDIAPMPKMKKDAMSASFVRTFGIPSSSKEPEAAFKFLHFMMKKEGQEILVKDGFGGPVLRSVGEGLYAQTPWPKSRSVYADALDYEAPHPKDILGAVWKRSLQDLGSDCMAGNITAKEYLDRITTMMEKRLSEIKKP
jgi:ABC-type glycerol-3-phosphate transport system substrate-binding protein